MKTSRLMLALSLLALLAVPLASAHKTAYTPDGKIKIVWGFLNEPAVTFTKNGLDLRIVDNATGFAIPDLQSGLKAEMHYGEDVEMEFKDFGGQFGKPGYYTGVITPTKAGIYVLHLSGTVNGTDVDIEIDSSHDVEDINDTYFPPLEHGSDASALEARVKALESAVTALQAKVKADSATPTTIVSQTPTGGSPAKPAPAAALGLVLVGVVALALVLRRRT